MVFRDLGNICHSILLFLVVVNYICPLDKWRANTEASKKYISAGKELPDESSNLFRKELGTKFVPGIC